MIFNKFCSWFLYHFDWNPMLLSVSFNIAMAIPLIAFQPVFATYGMFWVCTVIVMWLLFDFIQYVGRNINEREQKKERHIN